MKIRITSPTKKKIILLLEAGIALGLTHSPRTQKYIFKRLIKEWKDIDKQYLYKIVREFRGERLVEYVEQKDGSVKIVLSEKGKKYALHFHIDNMKINKPSRWDKKWRIVFFDVPEKKRMARDVLREKLKELGFYEIQKSTFIHPFPCLDEINFIAEYYTLRNMIRYGELININNEAELKLHFGLT